MNNEFINKEMARFANAIFSQPERKQPKVIEAIIFIVEASIQNSYEHSEEYRVINEKIKAIGREAKYFG